jgi:hypothetical protein
MRNTHRLAPLLLVFALCLALAMPGCSSPSSQPTKGDSHSHKAGDGHDHDSKTPHSDKDGHDHDSKARHTSGDGDGSDHGHDHDAKTPAVSSTKAP